MKSNAGREKFAERGAPPQFFALRGKAEKKKSASGRVSFRKIE